ncbi:MAG: phosphoribosylformylglycinamidine synthase subunit PurQ [Oscillospiraceae bacterium]|nr:phosphoribosylformylglycinamidine synthase subunit PurQ [Oscillospiraceae bacterium]
MLYDGNQILSLTRAFLNSNGAPKKTRAVVTGKKHEDIQDIFNIIYKRVKNEDIKQAYENLLSDINICAQKGLIEQFDSSAGGSAVISPLGGEQRLSPAQFMAAKIPADGGSEVRTASLMAYGFSPYISEISPYRGALYAVVESVSKLVAAGVNTDDIYLSFQEYFPRIAGDPSRFGLPFEALLGALKAQVNLELAAIGGKDSMSGTYTNEEDGVSIDVPPTLVSFAAGTANPVEIVSNEFKKAGSYVYLLKPLYDENNIIDFKDLKNLYAYLTKLIGEGRILSSYALGFGGIGEAVFKLCAGNAVGFAFDGLISQQELFASYYGAFIVESSSELPLGELLGKTTADAEININKTSLNLNKLTYRWLNTLEDIFPTGLNGINEKIKIEVPKPDYHIRPAQSGSIYKSAKPRVLIAALPGTNGEYETADRFEKAGALTETFIFRSLTPQAAAESFDELAKKINESQILVFPAGYSGGIVSSSVFTAAICARPAVRDAVRELLFVKDGLILGLGSGFAALVRLGLLPYGDFKNEADDFPSVTIGPNIIGRHNSFVTYTRISSVKSVWFAGLAAGDIHAVPVSHGEGRFYAAEDMLANLVHNGQIAAQYCDINGEAVMHPYFNPSGSDMAVEALFSPDGRILGKMGNSERAGRNVLKNVPGKTEQFIFSSGVKYFR